MLIGLGSNRGDRIAMMATAIGRLKRAGVSVRGVSPVYLTSPVGVAGQPWFHNAALAAETRFSPKSLLNLIHSIERGLGRTARKGWRTIDLDLLLHGSRVVADAGCVVPHPRFHERAFALAPAAATAPGAVHPVFSMTVRSLFAALHTRDRVRRCPRADQRRFRILLGSGGVHGGA